MSLSITRSVNGAHLQTNLYMGLTHVPQANTTLNELWNVHNNTTTGTTENPYIEYYCIGNLGHRFETGSDSIPYTSAVQHRASDSGLYRFLPFVVRPINDDLSPTERQNYGMRVPITISGVKWWAYYLKRIIRTNITPQVKKIVVENGIATVTEFIPDNSNLTPTPPEVPSSGAITTDGTFFSVTATLDLSFSADDVTKLINVADVIYGNSNLAVISEIGLVSAIRKSVALLDSNLQPVTGNYFEALKAQITSFANGYYPVQFSNQGFSFLLDLGATEPLFGPTVTSVQPGP